MAVKFNQKVKKEQVVAPKGEVEELIDSMGELNQAITEIEKQLTPLQESYQALLKDLIKIIDQVAGPEEKGALQGDDFQAEYGKKSDKTTVTDKHKLIKIFEQIQPGLFEELADVGVTNIKKFLNPMQQDQVIKVEAVGSRRVVVKPRPKF